MSPSEGPVAGPTKSLQDRAIEWAVSHYDKIVTYMKVSGSPDAAVYLAACAVFVVCVLKDYPYLGFAFGCLVVVAYTGITGARMVSAVKGKEHEFDLVVEEKLDGTKNEIK